MALKNIKFPAAACTDFYVKIVLPTARPATTGATRTEAATPPTMARFLLRREAVSYLE